MFNKIKQIIGVLVLFCGCYTQAQQQTKDIEKEEVVVEFSFNPTLSDVFKLKTNPERADNFQKKKVSYQITTQKVVSDFTPITQRASYVNIDKKKTESYKNYIYGAAGLYGNGELELFLRPQLLRGYQFGVDVKHQNNQNGISDKRVKNGSWNTDVTMFVGQNLKYKTWKGTVNYKRDQIHWYGLSPLVTDASVYQNKDLKQVYNGVTLQGFYNDKKAFVSDITPSVQIFTDGYQSAEVGAKVKATLKKSVFKQFPTEVRLGYLRGGFDQNYSTSNAIKYQFLNLGAQPSYKYQTEKMKLDMSLGFLLHIDTEASKTKAIVLPKFIASFPLVQNLMQLQLGVKSEFKQNSYAGLSAINPFVAPALLIQASHTPVHLFAALDGKLSKRISYAVEGGYKAIQNQALFLNQNVLTTAVEAYQLGNSFGVVYDDVNVVTFKGNVKASLSDRLSLGAFATLNTYDLDTQEKAWNLPNFKLETFANYQINNWFAQVGVNLLDGRNDFVNNQVIDVKGILDINAKGGYKINKRINAHFNIYNLLGNHYESFVNYQVQGFQAVAGLSYKF